MASVAIRIRGLRRVFGDVVAVDDVDLDVYDGEFLTLLGPSGSGKTTVLRMIAGFERPDAGTVELAGVDVTDVPPYARDVNTVFQDYALFPHMTVLQNVEYGLMVKKVPKAERLQRAQEALESVRLSGYEKRTPSQLSGGQRQRVALARALVNRPKVLLLDEPLGALDLKLRRSMQIEIKRIQVEVGLTFMHVTHDQEEAMTMADTVAVMNGGVIEQLGAPAELYENPRSTFVANFLGQSNLIEGRVLSRSADVTTLDMHGITVSVPTARTHTDGDRGWIGIRPEKVLIGEEGADLDAPGNTVPGGVVSDVSFVGVSTQYLVRMPWGQELQVFSQNTGRTRMFTVGEKVELSWRPEYAFCLDINQDAAAGVDDGEVR